MATSATTSKSNSTAGAKKTAAVKPRTVRKAAPAPAIKGNAAVVKEEARKLKAAAKAAKPGAKVKADKEKPRKAKLVRDSFTMPSDEYAVLGEMKKACLSAGVEVKKSELLRIGVSLLRQLDVAKVKAALGVLPALKAGRPKKSK